MSSADVRTEPAPGRSCGTCTLCCKVLKIAVLNKPRGAWCAHCRPGSGCKIYHDRPDACRTFMCMWLLDPRLGPEWKPEKSKLVVNSQPSQDGGIEIACDPGFPNAWRQEPFFSQIMKWAEYVRPQRGAVSITVGNSLTMLVPEGEFRVGQLQDDDQVVREFADGRLVNVRLAKSVEADGSAKRSGS